MGLTPELPPVVDLDAALERITQPWTPGVLADLNGQQLKLARLSGEFVGTSTTMPMNCSWCSAAACECVSSTVIERWMPVR